mmetsp:Transcript_3314/g.9947  ORF Transcript_3314/g.9947 Transcript_3314/m.9947 type:complete len:290 (-) Transcript_3314:369-1238(-)
MARATSKRSRCSWTWVEANAEACCWKAPLARRSGTYRSKLVPLIHSSTSCRLPSFPTTTPYNCTMQGCRTCHSSRMSLMSMLPSTLPTTCGETCTATSVVLHSRPRRNRPPAEPSTSAASSTSSGLSLQCSRLPMLRICWVSTAPLGAATAGRPAPAARRQRRQPAPAAKDSSKTAPPEATSLPSRPEKGTGTDARSAPCGNTTRASRTDVVTLKDTGRNSLQMASCTTSLLRRQSAYGALQSNSRDLTEPCSLQDSCSWRVNCNKGWLSSPPGKVARKQYVPPPWLSG